MTTPKTFILIAIILLVLVSIVSAAEIQYSEFAPERLPQSVNVSSVSTPYQKFIPLNNTISGIDIWIDNNGSSGLLTVNLRRDSDNKLIKSKSVAVPAISKTEGGKQFHIAFGESVPLENNDVYGIEFISSIPNLNLYYANLVDLLENTSSFSAEDIILSAYLGSEEQEFAFKFGLYEFDADVSFPSLSNISANVISPDETQISFNSDKPVDFRVLFAPSGEPLTGGTSFTGTYTNCSVGSPKCSISLVTTANTSYQYEITAKDSDGNESSAVGVFTSSENQTEEPLVLSNINVVSVTENSVAISWTTNIAANSSMLLSVSDFLGFRPLYSLGDETLELEHLLSTDSVLNPNIEYFAEIASFTQSGQQVKQEISFKTLEAPSPQEEGTEQTSTGTSQTAETNEETTQENQITAESSGFGSNISVSLKWDTSTGGASAGYRIDVFDSDNNLVTSLRSETNNIEVEGLEPGDYRAVVYSEDDGVFKKVADPVEFKVGRFFSGNSGLYVAISGLAVILSAILAFLVKKKKKIITKKLNIFIDRKSKKSKKSGFTLIEIVVATAILVIIIFFIGTFGGDVFGFGFDLRERFEVQQEVDLTMNEMITEVRSVSQSNEGSYPIAEAGTSTFTFYSDKKGDGLIEKIRYFLDQGTLKKGIIEPSGTPLQYNPSDEIIKDVVHNIATGTSTIFVYYDKNFTGTEPPLAQPVTISDIRMVEINLSAKKESQATPITFTTRVTPRNLRTNL